MQGDTIAKFVCYTTCKLEELNYCETSSKTLAKVEKHYHRTTPKDLSLTLFSGTLWLLWGFGSLQLNSSPSGVHDIVPEKRNDSLLPHLLLSVSFQKILPTISWMAINATHTVGIIAKVSRMNQTFCTYVTNDVTMLVKVFCTCARKMKTGKPVMIVGYKKRWIFTVLHWYSNASWQLFRESFGLFRRAHPLNK